VALKVSTGSDAEKLFRHARHPPVVIDGAIAEHLELLHRVPGRGFGVRLIPGVRHAHAFDGALLMPLIVSGAGMPVASRMVGTMSMM
jgi:hypothetical protein